MKPIISDAPGLRWRKRRSGAWEARWIARGDLVKRGFRPVTQWLWQDGIDKLDDATADYIRDQCRRLQNDMLAFSRGARAEPAEFNGSVASLIDVYRSDPDSPYHALRYITRTRYDVRLNRLRRTVGERALSALTFRDFKNWYERVRFPEGKDGPDRVSVAHAIIAIWRTVVRFGAVLELKHCERIAMVLSKMQFGMARPRTQELTAGMAADIIRAAHEVGRPSIALAQALQFELTLRQKDVIGEWIPISEPGISEYTGRGVKWLRGMNWNEISPDLIIRHPISKSRQGKIAEFDFKLYPMVIAEIGRIPVEARSGAVVKDEDSGMPYRYYKFRENWRTIAEAAGVPTAVKNMDSRAGGITETTEATGGDLEAARHQAGHSDVRTTQRYSRGAKRRVAAVAVLRTEFRGKEK